MAVDQTELLGVALMWRLDPRYNLKLEPSEFPCLEVGLRERESESRETSLFCWRKTATMERHQLRWRSSHVEKVLVEWQESSLEPSEMAVR